MTNEQRILQLVQQIRPNNPLQYVHNIVKDYCVEQTKQHILECKDCDICNTFKTLPHGNTNASLMIIGDYPVTEHNKECEALFENDYTKKTLTTVLYDMFHIKEEQVFYCNTINCHPYKINDNQKTDRLPCSKELNNCIYFVNYLIKVVQPLAIILLGSTSLCAYNKDFSLLKDHGKFFDIKGIPALATYHPNYFITQKKYKDEELITLDKKDFIDDIQKIVDYLKDTYPDIKIFSE